VLTEGIKSGCDHPRRVLRRPDVVELDIGRVVTFKDTGFFVKRRIAGHL